MIATILVCAQLACSAPGDFVTLDAYEAARRACVTRAIAAQAADIGTTALGLARGLVEANPLGLPLVIAAKVVGLRLARRRAERSCDGANALFASGAAAALSNSAALLR